MRVAAYQAPLAACCSPVEALALIKKQIEWCESAGVKILCCPEAILGGLADYAEDSFAVRNGQLNSVLAPITSDSVTTIVGFIELGKGGELYNSAAVFRGSVSGVYRKLHPAINRSVYQAGTDVPVFEVDELTFGIVICNDSNFVEPAKRMAAKGATALFIPTNNGLPRARFGREIVGETRKVDIARAVENRIWVIRADVAGRCDDLVSYGSSEIVDPNGMVVQSARELSENLIVAEIGVVKSVP